jgi:hypothetical protein
MEFQLNQQLVPQHRKGCKYHGLPLQKKKAFRAQVPVIFGQLLGRINRACVEYTAGAGRPGISLRFINIVPKRQSPIVPLLDQISDSYGRIEQDVIRTLETAERAVLSLYRDGKSQPWDLTETGESHETASRIPLHLDQVMC